MTGTPRSSSKCSGQPIKRTGGRDMEPHPHLPPPIGPQHAVVFVYSRRPLTSCPSRPPTHSSTSSASKPQCSPAETDSRSPACRAPSARCRCGPPAPTDWTVGFARSCSQKEEMSVVGFLPKHVRRSLNANDHCSPFSGPEGARRKGKGKGKREKEKHTPATTASRHGSAGPGPRCSGADSWRARRRGGSARRIRTARCAGGRVG